MMATTTTTTENIESEPKVKNTVVHFNIDRQCPVQSVTVYNDRAEVTRSVQHHFEKEGIYELVFQGFSPCVDLTSIHVSGATSNACTILEVSHGTRTEKCEEMVELTSVDQLQKDLSQAQQERSKHDRELNRLNKQRSWLDGRATKLMNQDGLMNPEALESMEHFMEFYHRNLSKLDEDTAEKQKLIADIDQKLQSIQEEITKRGVDAKSQNGKVIREVTVVVHIGAENINVNLEIAYLISNCSWCASYDVRVNNSDGARPRTQLTYYGIIVNQSQENWSDIELSLSTAKPSLSGVAPKLETLKVRYYIQPWRYDKAETYASLRSSGLDALEDKTEMLEKASGFLLKKSRMSFRGRESLKRRNSEQEDNRSTHSVNFLETTAESSLSSTNFAIPRRATIEADGKPHKVTVGVLDLVSTFTYTIVPKSSTNAFLKAKTVNTSDKHLLAGPASVFMNNNFVTHSTIENVCVGDTFDLSLGTDPSIKVEYKTIKKLADNHGILTKVKQETIRNETRLNNTKPCEVTVFIYEQVPLSDNDKIKVKLLQPELRNKDRSETQTVTMNDSNNLERKCVLSARSELRLTTEYSVEWPADKRIDYCDS